jgi:hypothetical protein
MFWTIEVDHVSPTVGLSRAGDSNTQEHVWIVDHDVASSPP